MVLSLWVVIPLGPLSQGSPVRCPAYQICMLQFITVAKSQLWSSNEIILWLGLSQYEESIKGSQQSEGWEHCQFTNPGLCFRSSHLAFLPQLSHFITLFIYHFHIFGFCYNDWSQCSRSIAIKYQEQQFCRIHFKECANTQWTKVCSWLTTTENFPVYVSDKNTYTWNNKDIV